MEGNFKINLMVIGLTFCMSHSNATSQVNGPGGVVQDLTRPLVGGV